jgi:hypothetical protein
VGYRVHRRRLCRLQRRIEQWEATQSPHVSIGEVSPAPVDIPALHRSLAAKKQAVRNLVAFARELMGVVASLPPQAEDPVSNRPMHEEDRAEDGSHDEPPHDPEPLPPPTPPPRYEVRHYYGMQVVIDTHTGLMCDGATTMQVLAQQKPP